MLRLELGLYRASTSYIPFHVNFHVVYVGINHMDVTVFIIGE